MPPDPPLVRAGLNECPAQRRGAPARVAQMVTSTVLWTEATHEMQDCIKARISANDDGICGLTRSGAQAGAAVAAVQTPMLADPPYPKHGDPIFAHPTLAEGLSSLFSRRPPLARRGLGSQHL